MTLRISSCSLMMMTMTTTMMMTKMTTVMMMMIVIVLKVMMVCRRCDVSDDDDNNFYSYGDVYSDGGDGVMTMMMVTLRIKSWMVMMMMMMTVVEMTLTSIIQWEWWLSLPQSLQCILRKKQFACVYIKKVFIGFNSLSDQHNIWRHSSDAVRVQGHEESKF